MSRDTELLYGTAETVAHLLGGDNPPDQAYQLRMALTNAMQRIAKLEAQVTRLQEQVATSIDAKALARIERLEYYLPKGLK